MKYSLKDISLAVIAAFCIYTAVEKEVRYVAISNGDGKGEFFELASYWTLTGCRTAHKGLIGNYISSDLTRRSMSNKVTSANFAYAWVCVPN